MPDVTMRGPIQKIDDDQQIVYIWASVITKNGVPVEDTQGDKISPLVLQECAHDFIDKSRVGGFMHVPGLEAGRIVESMVFTYDLQKSMGIVIKDKDGNHIEGWLTAYSVDSKELWKRVKAGDFAEASIGGEAIRVPETTNA